MRPYSLSATGTVSTAAELVSVALPTGSTRLFRPRRLIVGCSQTPFPAAQMLAIELRRLLTGVQAGGGLNTNFMPLDRGVVLPTFTNWYPSMIGLTLSPTLSTGAVTQVLAELGVYLYAGLDLLLPDGIEFTGTDVFSAVLLNAPASPLTLTVTLWCDEAGY